MEDNMKEFVAFSRKTFEGSYRTQRVAGGRGIRKSKIQTRWVD